MSAHTIDGVQVPFLKVPVTCPNSACVLAGSVVHLTVYTGNRGGHCVCGVAYDLSDHQEDIGALALPAAWQNEETA
jgi:hypothetical protein